MTEKVKKKKKEPLHVTTVRALFFAAVLSIAAFVFSFCFTWGIYQGKVEAQAETDVFQTFDLATLDGGRLTAAELSSSKIIFVNVWGTDCPPCIYELPDLEEVSKTFKQEDLRIIGVPLDVTNGEEVNEDLLNEAKRLVETAGVTFSNVIPDQKMAGFLNSVIAATPTTFILDSKGEILGSVTGSRDFDGWKETAEQYLAEGKQ